MPHPFDALMELDHDQIRLDCAALHVARDAYPHLSVPKYLSTLDGLAQHVASRRPGLSAIYRYQAMREVLVSDFDLRGNADDYYDPENSYLNRVLDRGLGIPISLSVVWIEVARRLKWPVVGVGFPGHFLVRFEDEERYVLADPYHGGKALSLNECEQLLEKQFESQVQFSMDLLNPIDTRSILGRMLGNLRTIYAANQDWANLENILRRLAALEPEAARHRQELAALACRNGRMRLAYEHLSAYMQRQPQSDDARAVAHDLRQVEAAMATCN